jgi:hypothetical protein
MNFKEFNAVSAVALGCSELIFLLTVCRKSRIAKCARLNESGSMKTLVLAALFMAPFSLSLHAQVGTDPRALTKRIAPLLPPPQPSVRPAHVVPAGTAPAAPSAAATAADAEEKQMQMSLEAKKKLQWETDRAEKGSDSMQYTLGMRYLKGDGAPQDLKKARKWLEASAKQGNPDAKKALAEHPELPPYDPKEDAAKTADAKAAPTAAPDTAAATTTAKKP